MMWLKNKMVGNIAALFLSVCIFLGMFEIIVRIFLPQRIETPLHYFAPDAELGWKIKPNLNSKYTAADFSMLVKTNDRGFRDIAHTYEKDQGTYRIVGIGDSMLFGHGVENEEIVINRLQELLSDKLDNAKKVEAINLGVSRYNVIQYDKSLRIEGARYKPDLVIMFYYVGNDWIQYARYAWGGVNKQGFLIGADTFFSFDSVRNFLAPIRFFLKSRSQAYMLVRDRVKGFLMKSKLMSIPVLDIYRKDFNLEKKCYFTLEKIKEVDRYCKNILQCHFILCIIPEKVQVRKPLLNLCINTYQLKLDDYDFMRPQHILVKYCLRNDIDFVDLAAALALAEEKEPVYLPIDWHWNKKGHLLAAHELFDHIRKKEIFN